MRISPFLSIPALKKRKSRVRVGSLYSLNSFSVYLLVYLSIFTIAFPTTVCSSDRFVLSATKSQKLSEVISITQTYDRSYAEIYDQLWRRDEKYRWEAAEIQKWLCLWGKKTIARQENKGESNRSEVRIKLLDGGCGTGTHYSLLATTTVEMVGLDISPGMLDMARKKNPQGKFICGSLCDRSLFEGGSFTHIMSMYEATFYNRGLVGIFSNYHLWLRDGGLLFIEMINPDNIFENIAPMEFSTHYTKKGKYIAHQMAALTRYRDLETHTWWEILPEDFRAIYHEQINYKDGRKEKKEHTLYLPPPDQFEAMMASAGFQLMSKKEVVNDSSELFYVFKKVANGK